MITQVQRGFTRLLGRLGPSDVGASVMRLLAHLLGVFAVCSANPLLSLFSKAKSLASARNIGITALLPALNTVREAASAAEDDRQGLKDSLREKASETAKYCVWLHLDRDEKAAKEIDCEEFTKMVETGLPRMRKKLRRRGLLSRLFTSTPSNELVKMFLEEEVAKTLKEKKVSLKDGDNGGYLPLLGARKTSEAACRPSESEKKPKEEKPCPKGSLCFPWPKLAWIKPPPMCTIPKDSKVATQTKFGKRILVAVASALLGVALLPFK